MRRAAIASIAPLDSENALQALIPRFIDSLRSGNARIANAEFAATCSRKFRTRELARILDGSLQETAAESF
jgi:hypothetical protein